MFLAGGNVKKTYEFMYLGGGGKYIITMTKFKKKETRQHINVTTVHYLLNVKSIHAIVLYSSGSYG